VNSIVAEVVGHAVTLAGIASPDYTCELFESVDMLMAQTEMHTLQRSSRIVEDDALMEYLSLTLYATITDTAVLLATCAVRKSVWIEMHHSLVRNLG
jgi:hypothetical protein